MSSEDSSSTTSSAKKISAGILLSRLTGLLRESLLRSVLGLGPAADAFAAALRIPNLLQNLLGEGSLSSSFIPVYSRLISEGKEEEAGKVAGAIAGLLIAFTGGLTLIGIFMAKPIAKILTPGFTSEKLDLTADLIKITTCGIGFLVLAAWCLGVLNSHRKFFLSYVAPVIWNVAQVIVLIIAISNNWEPTKAAKAAAWGLLLGGAAQLLLQFSGVLKLRNKIRISFDAKNSHVKEIVKRFNPAVIGRGVVQISAYFDLLLASLLATGAVAALISAQVLYILPVSLFALSLAAAELPEMSRNIDNANLLRRLDQGIKKVSFLMLITSVIYISLGDQIIGILFQWGSFSRDDTILVAATLAVYSLGLPAIGCTRILQTALYARGDTKTPAIAASIRVAIALFLGLLLMFPFDRLYISDGSLNSESGGLFSDWGPLSQGIRSLPENPHLGAVGLAAASAMGAWFEMFFLNRKTNKELPPRASQLSPISKLLPAALTALIVVTAGRLLLPATNEILTNVIFIPLALVSYIFIANKNKVEESLLITKKLKAESKKLRKYH